MKTLVFSLLALSLASLTHAAGCGSGCSGEKEKPSDTTTEKAPEGKKA